MDARFQTAEAALASGDVELLTTLLTADPDLATARSTQSHPTLLQCLVLTMPPVACLESFIELLADHGAELTDPLIAASGIDNVRAIVKLLDLGARIEGNGRWSPLEEALYFGNEAAVSRLLKHGAAPENLRTAAGLGDMAWIARCFDESGNLTAVAGKVASPFSQFPIPAETQHDPQQIIGNALVFAAHWGRTEAVDYLLAQGGQVNMIPAGFDFAGTPLHYAAHAGRRATVDQLLQRGADPALRDTKIGALPEDWAEHFGHTDLAAYLRQLHNPF